MHHGTRFSVVVVSLGVAQAPDAIYSSIVALAGAWPWHQVPGAGADSDIVDQAPNTI